MSMSGVIKRYSPTALSILGAIGVVATVVTAIKATPKALDILEKKKKETGEDLKPVEVVKATWTCYIPTMILGAGTILCIAGSNFLNKKAQLNLAGAYALGDMLCKQNLSRHMAYVPSEDAPAQIVRENAEVCSSGIDFPDEKVLWYFEPTGETFERYERELMNAEYHLNRNLIQRGYASVNEFREFLGLDWIPKGDEIGWSITEGYYWADFEHRIIEKDDGGQPMYEVVPIFYPNEYYMEDWDYPHYDE